MTISSLESSIEGRVGIRIDRAMRGRLDQYVRDAARERGLSVAEYGALVTRDEAVRQLLVDRLLVPTTEFFRHPEQFRALEHLIREWDGAVTIWSAACSTGQEPYSLAMLLQESGRRDWRVIGSDISSVVTAHAAAATYGPRDLRGLSPERRRRYLEPAGAGWRVIGELRERVLFVRHNLATDDVPAKARGAVAMLCRNVLIYLRPEVQHQLLDRLADQMPSLKALFVGSTESLWGVTDRFLPVSMDGAYAYVPAGHRATPARSTPPAGRMPVKRPRPALPARRAAPDHAAEGEAALAAGQWQAAIAAFRKACYLDPDDPLAHLQLGMALDSAGEGDARRAYAAARAAMERRGIAVVEADLKGFKAAELLGLIERRLR